jgi:endonuclease/exonuclease/phosphatase (EEP) superfamily protein YafD
MPTFKDLYLLARILLGTLVSTPWPRLSAWLSMVLRVAAYPLGIWALLILLELLKHHAYALTGLFLWLYSPVAALALFAAANAVLVRKPWAKPPGTLRLAHLNTYVINGNAAPKLKFLRASGADLISLVEVNQGLLAALDGLADLYPHRYVSPAYLTNRRDPRPMHLVVLSRTPLTVVREWPRAVLCRVGSAGGPVHLLQCHAPAPITPREWDSRNALLAEAAAALPARLMLVGDFNTVPWDGALAPLKRALTFRGPWAPTWPAVAPLLPIDLLFSSPAFKPTALERLAVGGTDHLALLADFPVDDKGLSR